MRLLALYDVQNRFHDDEVGCQLCEYLWCPNSIEIIFDE